MNSEVELLTNILNEQVEWRISEIASLKTIPYKNNISRFNRDLLMKYSVPAFYALWEGYVVVSVQEYVNMINGLNLECDEIHPKLIAHDIDMKHNLRNGRINLQPRVDFCVQLKEYFSTNVKISTKVPTKSNVCYKTINTILNSLNLGEFDKCKFEYPLTQLIKYRNDIAHGENSLIIDEEIVLKLSTTVIDCMDELTDLLIEGATNKFYKA